MMSKEVQESLLKEIEDMQPIKSTDSKEVIKEKLKSQTEVLNKLYTIDAFQNQMARLGFGQPNLNEGADYPLTRMSQNYNLFTSLYRSSWIVRKIVDVFPSDMVKNWIKFNSSLDPEKISKINSVIRKTKTKEKIKEGLRWARLYGGAAGLILIDGDEDLSEPLDYDTIMLDDYKGLLIFDRWNGIYPDIELEDDISDEEYGYPKYYSISLSEANNNLMLSYNKQDLVKVHHSRIVRFNGRDLPLWERQAEMFWGESEIEIVFEELKKRDNTSANIASLIFLANIRVLKMNDLGQLLGASTQKAQENLYKVLQAQNQLMSNMGIYVMDKDDDFGSEQYSFGGLNDIYESFMLDIAGACEMPVTKLFGREPAGFNSTGESDLTQYYDTLEEKQETYLQPIIDKLLPIIFMSTLGAIPEDLDWEFNPCMNVNSKDLADLAQSMASPIFEAFNAGLITKEIALKELKQQNEKTGMWSNITDEDIKNAKNEDNSGEYTNEEQESLMSELNPEQNDMEEIYNENINIQKVSDSGWRERVKAILRKKVY
jgi:phage-related protein (TIGR01555 family)